MFLTIRQWNARSLIANGQEFKKYIDNLIEKPNVICIQETWLIPQLDFLINGYNVIRRDRESGRGGGIATFIQNGMKYKVVQINKDNESIISKIWTERGCIDIINYYNPCAKLSQTILEAVAGPLYGNAVWCGDFNSYNSLWGSNKTDVNGQLIEEFIDDNDLVCINNGEGMRYNSLRNKETALDLTFVSTIIAGISTWSVIKHTTIGSDHYPIVTTVGAKICYEKEKRSPRWKLEKVNWEVFQVICGNRCMTLLEENQMDVNEFNNKLVSEIIQSAEEVIPKTTGIRRVKNVPWWNDDCKVVVKARNKAFRQLKKTAFYGCHDQV